MCYNFMKILVFGVINARAIRKGKNEQTLEQRGKV